MSDTTPEIHDATASSEPPGLAGDESTRAGFTLEGEAADKILNLIAQIGCSDPSCGCRPEAGGSSSS
jgi:hypothetical protein